jgi:hypothetical protein
LTPQKLGLGKLRYLLGDGYTEQHARALHALLDRKGLLGGAGEIDPQRLVGLAEVAEMMNRTVQAVRAWRDLPEPLVRLKSGPIYDRLHIEGFRAARPELCGVRAPADA